MKDWLMVLRAKKHLYISVALLLFIPALIGIALLAKNQQTPPTAIPVQDLLAPELVMPAAAGPTDRLKVQVTPTEAAQPKQTINLQDLPSPVKGTILRPAGNYYSESLQAYLFHAGTDYAEPEGTVIRATHQGKVVFAGPDPILGQKVIIDCGQGWLVTYGGLDNLQVKDGDDVESLAVLGQVSQTPGAEGLDGQSHLHYEIWYEDEVILAR